MRILFITKNFKGGGLTISNRNKEVLKRSFPGSEIKTYVIQKSVFSLKLLFDRIKKSYCDGLTQRVVTDILLLSINCDIVFVDGSSHGTLSRELRDNGFGGKILVFFHNIETNFVHRSWWQKLLYPIFNGPLNQSEKLACKYSDIVITLTKRDSDYLEKYFISPVFSKKIIMPSSVVDTFDESKVERDLVCRGHLSLLFVGSSMRANLEGINWCINNVMNSIDAHLVVVGNGMDKVLSIVDKRIHIYGYVEDLSDFYARCDCIVEPIFTGSGMKTKTTEALMWGKYIIGTDEAFVGFEVNKEIGKVCNSSHDFITALNELSLNGVNRYNKASRDLFVRNYTLDSSVAILQSAISNNANYE